MKNSETKSKNERLKRDKDIICVMEAQDERANGNY